MKTESLVGIITLACNFQCLHCIREFNRSPHIDSDLFINVMKQAKDFGYHRVSFTGGEPCLHPDFEKFCYTAAELDLRINAVTNGWLYDRYDFLKNPIFSTNGSPTLNFSIDGCIPEIHDHIRKDGSFERIIAGIKRAKASNINVTMNCCLNKLNHDHVEGIIQLSQRLGVNHCVFTTAIKTSQNLNIVLSNSEKQQLTFKILTLKKKYPSVYISTCTALDGSITNRDLKFNYTLCSKINGYVEATINSYGYWQYCCDTILDGDNSLGHASTVSLAKAVQGQLKLGAEMASSRIQRLTDPKPVPEDWYTCEYCNSFFTPKLVNNVDTSIKKKVIQLKKVE